MFLWLSAALFAAANTNLSADVDLRAGVDEWADWKANVHRLATGVRSSFSDRKGDRLALYGLLETEDDFSEWSLHEMYARYKGPLGKYNITLGRFGLPYGLLSGIDPTRLLYETHSMKAVGLHVDNGLMATGVFSRFDYAVSFTQGIGAHDIGFPGHGLFMARLGMAVGDTDEFQLGLSGVAGKTVMHEKQTGTVNRIIGALDATIYIGPFLFKAEWNAGELADALFLSSFIGLEYPIAPKLDMLLTSLNSYHHDTYNNHFFTGAAWRLRWFTIRGGYRYAFQELPEHQLKFQIYRLFTHTL